VNRILDDRGLGIIEILMAILFFSLVAAGLLRTTVGATQGNLQSKNIGVASALIYDKVEQLRALDVSTNPADLTEGHHPDPSNPMTATGQPDGHFIRTWDVTADVPRHGLSEVVITVSWPGLQPNVVQGVTYVCNTSTCG
jgi:hypothetical protein